MTARDRIATLASFFSCSAEEAAKVEAATRLAHYGHKDILAHQGDLGAKLWIVKMIDSTIIRAHHCSTGAKGGLRVRVSAAQKVAFQPRSFSASMRLACP